MKKQNFKVESNLKGFKLTITINNIPHLIIPYTNDIVGIQSYYEGVNEHIIEIILKQGKILMSYDKEYKWLAVINELNKIIQ